MTELVSTDPATVAALHARDAAGADAVALADFAAQELGLRPQNWPANTPVPPIVLSYPASGGEPVFVWARYNQDADQADDDWDPDADDPWAGLTDWPSRNARCRPRPEGTRARMVVQDTAAGSGLLSTRQR